MCAPLDLEQGHPISFIASCLPYADSSTPGTILEGHLNIAVRNSPSTKEFAKQRRCQSGRVWILVSDEDHYSIHRFRSNFEGINDSTRNGLDRPGDQHCCPSNRKIEPSGESERLQFRRKSHLESNIATERLHSFSTLQAF
jgi:hypothetical protein